MKALPWLIFGGIFLLIGWLIYKVVSRPAVPPGTGASQGFSVFGIPIDNISAEVDF
jgi:hypothetical protein